MRQTETTAHTEAEARYPRTILGTACVPWRADWSLDEDLFRAGVRGLIGEGMKHLYVFDYARVPGGDACARRASDGRGD